MIDLALTLLELASERKSAIDHFVNQVSKQRELTINQFVENVTRVRRQTIEDFFAEEKRMCGLLTDLKQTLVAGNDVLDATNILVERLNLGQVGAGMAASSEPFDIEAYRATLQEASKTIVQLNSLLMTVDKVRLDKV